MKLSATVDSLARENHYLKKLALLQTVSALALAGLLYSSFDKSPVIVERSVYGLEILRPTEYLRTTPDLKTGVNLMMKARFDSGTISPEPYLNPKQIELRSREQAELKNRNLKQAVVVENVTIDNDQAVVDLTRLISVGEVRSALKTRLKLKFESVTPNPLNPYGVLLSSAEPVAQSPLTKEEK